MTDFEINSRPQPLLLQHKSASLTYLFRISALVRVLLDGNRSERFLDLLWGSILAHIQKLIEALVVNLFLFSSRTATTSHEVL